MQIGTIRLDHKPVQGHHADHVVQLGIGIGDGAREGKHPTRFKHLLGKVVDIPLISEENEQAFFEMVILMLLDLIFSRMGKESL